MRIVSSDKDLMQLVTDNVGIYDTMKDKEIGILLGGVSAEREVSLTSGAAVRTALGNRGYDAREVVDDGR